MIGKHYLLTLNGMGRVVRIPFYASIRHFSRLFDFSAHTDRTRNGGVYEADRGESPTKCARRSAKTFGDFMRLRRQDLQDVGRRIVRSKLPA
ncbi:Putative integrase family protein [Methylocystis sp. SC2]|nr:Putative integrase family protein [Methylocystis sp. SC2]